MATAGDGGEATRAALIRAAEQLMARHGVEGVDLKDIQLTAGQRNRSAVNYHFKDRAGLVRAIGNKHRAAINPDRHRMLDHLERRAPSPWPDWSRPWSSLWPDPSTIPPGGTMW